MTIPKKPRPDDMDRPESGPGSPVDQPHVEADPADFEEDDEVGPQGGYGGTGPDQSRPKR